MSSTNAHRLARGWHGHYYCAAHDCDWRADRPRKGEESVLQRFQRHLYELVPKRGRER